jgi:hypothetical protein
VKKRDQKISIKNNSDEQLINNGMNDKKKENLELIVASLENLNMSLEFFSN